MYCDLGIDAIHVAGDPLVPCPASTVLRTKQSLRVRGSSAVEGSRHCSRSFRSRCRCRRIFLYNCCLSVVVPDASSSISGLAATHPCLRLAQPPFPLGQPVSLRCEFDALIPTRDAGTWGGGALSTFRCLCSKDILEHARTDGWGSFLRRRGRDHQGREISHFRELSFDAV